MRWFVPAVLVILGGISLLTLRSVATELATFQFVFVLISLTAYLAVSRVPFEWWLKTRWVWYAGLNIMLVTTLLLGSVTRGSARWLPLGPVSAQPSQFAVPVVALVVGMVIARRGINNWRQLASGLGLIALPAGLIAIEPDLGTAIVLVLSMGVVLWLGNLSWKYAGALLLALAFVAVIGWTSLLQPYQQQRLTSFVQQQQGQAGYNARQSLIAVGSGQVFGKGLGQGSQSHLRFLPERQTDFIFASLAEEWGFVGSTLVIGLYAVLVWYLLGTSTGLHRPAGSYLIVAVASLIALQTVINIGMNMSLLPITGITLPFISYGGSSLLATALMLGLAQSALSEGGRSYSTHVG